MFPRSAHGQHSVCGIVYAKAKNIFGTLIGEVFGTAVLGGLCAYPVAIFFMGQGAADLAFYAYIVPFLISTVLQKGLLLPNPCREQRSISPVLWRQCLILAKGQGR